MKMHLWAVNFFADDRGVVVNRLDGFPIEECEDFVLTHGVGAHVKALSPVAAILKAHRMMDEERIKRMSVLPKKVQP